MPMAMDPPAEKEEKVEGEDPMLDMQQLEELHDEAERMKALGNKHMAAQVRRQYTHRFQTNKKIYPFDCKIIDAFRLTIFDFVTGINRNTQEHTTLIQLLCNFRPLDLPLMFFYRTDQQHCCH